MALLVLGLVLFLGIHSVSIVAGRWRLARIATMGEQRWKGLYSIVALVGLVLIVYGFGVARVEGPILWVSPRWLRHVALLVMLPVFPLLVAAYVPGRIRSAAKHPMLVAVKCWALAHLLANGSLADVLLFGSFLAWAVADRISVKRRPADEQHAIPAAPPRAINDVLVVVIGLAIYAAFLAGVHRWLFGVSPLG